LTRLFIVAGVIGSLLSLLAITLDGFLRPGYSPFYQVISDLGVGQNAWLLNSDLVISGLLIMLFAIGFSQAMRNSISGRRLVASTSLFLFLSRFCFVIRTGRACDRKKREAVSFGAGQ
jgi:hypothetical membrane protein